MANIDASGLNFSLDAFDINSVDFNTGTATPFSYSWSATGGNQITALGYLGDFTPALAGTVHSINIQDSSSTPGLSIHGLNNPLTDFIDAGSALTSQQKFWDTVLEGETFIETPQFSSVLNLMGDFVSVGTGQTRTGSADTFNGSSIFDLSGTLSGDADGVLAGGTLHGGNDQFLNTPVSFIYGDVGDGSSSSPDNGGTVFGGDDLVRITDPNYNPTYNMVRVVGDVEAAGPNSLTTGGADTLLLRNLSNVSEITGDVYSGDTAEITGGDDRILLETTIPGRIFVNASSIAGDVQFANSSTGAGSVIGGDDHITLNNVNSASVAGDAFDTTSVQGAGGDDLIEIAGTVPLTTPPPPYQVTPSMSEITGDFRSFGAGAGNDLTGGDDRILVSDVFTSSVYGDANNFTGSGGAAFAGGDDLIDYAFNVANTSTSVSLFGDAGSLSVSDGEHTMGDDTILFDNTGSLGGGGVLFGDVSGYSGSDSGYVVFGDDRIEARSNSGSSVALYGDAASLSSPGNLAAGLGDDTLIAGAGNDTLYGDFQTNSVTGILSGALVGGVFFAPFGDDVLDGGDGNDSLFGGDGSDTASFASVQRPVTVFLEGIPGSGTPGIHAIGQGNDTFDSIENVIGSRGSDVIVGDANDNVIEGGLSGDFMVGNGGNDTLSYASSGASVNISLASGFAGGPSGSHALGDDFVHSGLPGFTNVIGSAFDDRLTGDSGDNLLSGLEGNDTLIGGTGADQLNGGEGFDWADYSASGAAVSVDLGLPPGSINGTGGDANMDVVFNVEALRGSNFGDILNGGSGDNILEGRGGGDTYDGGGQGALGDTVSYATSGAFVNVSLLTGFAGGGAGNHAAGDTFSDIENLIGSQFSDILNGDNSDNRLEGRLGGDVLNGNGGFDTADYKDSAGFVNVSLLTGFAGGGSGSHAIGDTLNSIEDLAGSRFGDVLNGDNNGNILEGRAGADMLNGNGGSDAASYASSSEGVIVSLGTGFTSGGDAVGDMFSSIEDLIGSNFDDFLSGGTGVNTLIGQDGDDILRGRLGADELDGGNGIDTADYADAPGAVNVSLQTGFTAGAHASGDVFIDIENLTGSNGYGDTLNGDGDDNVLTGLGGNDSLVGNAGSDTFVFGAGWGADIVGDFQDGLDRLDFSGNAQIEVATDLTVTASGGNAVVADMFGNTVTLIGAAGDVSGDDFIF